MRRELRAAEEGKLLGGRMVAMSAGRGFESPPSPMPSYFFFFFAAFFFATLSLTSFR